MFQFELQPHICEIHTEFFVYEKCGVIKHIKAPARVNVKRPDLRQNIFFLNGMTVVCLSLSA